MNKVFYVGAAMAIPPYGWIFESLGLTVQFLGIAIQVLGLGFMVGSKVIILRRKGG
ncbi:MAG: hypothetical protein IMF11_17370 [Proteobacteria bacterium]|nr:hypothetical protein [Pseudomonadota bacterium]